MTELLIFLALFVGLAGLVFDEIDKTSGEDRKGPPRPWC